MKLTVLGSSGTYPRPGGACNGFLIMDGGANLVLELGNGCLSNLLKVVDFTELDAVVITHMHIDHFGDLYPLYYALRFHTDEPWGLRVLMPGGGLELMGCILGEDAREYLPLVFNEEPISAGVAGRVGDIGLNFFPTRHPVEGYSVRLQGKDWSLAYSSDTAPCPGLYEAAAGVDLFICEATLPVSYARQASQVHMTTVEAGEAALKAGVQSLLLTHIWPTFDPEDMLDEVQAAYPGDVALAHEGLTLQLGGGEDAQE